MSDTLYEKSNTGDDGYITVMKFGGVITWEAMSFTPLITHTITSVKLLAYRISDGGNVGSATLSIRTSSGHLPTGSDLVSGTKNVDTMTEDTAGLWYEITLGTGTLLIAGIEYTMLIRVPNASSNNCRLGLRVTNPGTYTSGQPSSADEDVGWALYGGSPAFDWQFEEYGLPIPGEGQGLLAVVGETLHYVSKNGIEYTIQGTPV